jgi:uncharacterized membrane protein YciS (DUF1049 family)
VIKLIFSVVLLVLTSMFFMQNMNPVGFHLLIGNAVNVRLSYLLSTFFFLGFSASSILNITRAMAKRRSELMEQQIARQLYDD